MRTPPAAPRPPLVRPVGGEPLPSATAAERLRSRVDHVARVHPARLTLSVFAAVIVVATCLLSLPVASSGERRAPFEDVLFTAVSAVSVTGLEAVNTASYWSPFGHVVILFCIQIGGLGVMTLASILGYSVSRRLGLTGRMLAATETGAPALGQVGGLLSAVLLTSSVAESTLFAVYLPRFLTLGYGFGASAWNALFMSVSVFNNAGFLILPEGLAPHASDWWMLTPVVLGSFAGAIGFPVISDLVRHRLHARRLTVHTKLTLTTYLALGAAAAVCIGISEWNNPYTLGRYGVSTRVLNLLVSSVNSRSSGLSALNVGAMDSSTWFITDILMFIGGGSASSAGGIKVSTIAVLALAVIAEARGDRDVEAFHRRIPTKSVRLAIAVTMIGAALVAAATIWMLTVTDNTLDVVLFEVCSAFGTAGLSTGLVPGLPAPAKYVLTGLMFLGRTGTMAFPAALALHERRRVIRMPAERPIIG